MAARSWLITAFNPFLKRPVNHSMQVIDQVLELNQDPELKIYTAILPTEYEGCYHALLREIQELKTKGVTLMGVLSLGEAKENFVIETQANNLDHADYEDNTGIQRSQQKIFPDRGEILPLRFPFARFQIATSLSPGFFVCNHLCARMAVATELDPTLPPFGFIHVPRSDLQRKFTTLDCARGILTGL